MLFLTGLEENKATLKKKAQAVHSISVVAERDSVIFVKKMPHTESVEGIALMTQEELISIDDPADLEDTIEKKKRRA